MMSRGPRVLVEVCVDSVASAVAAERGGAARVELCGSLIEGGITPSAGLIEATRAAVSAGISIMIRPRGGDFCYEADEFEIMRRDIVTARNLGVDGVVFGLLDVNGNVDVARTQQLIGVARPLSVTFHRAFDMTSDLFRALDDICAAGVDRVLTSGGETSCVEGAEALRKLVGKAGKRIEVMPGGGINLDNARTLVEHTGVKQIHVSLRSAVPSPMLYRNPRVDMGSLDGQEYERFFVLEEQVSQLCASLQNSDGD
jgi:copper homeostasis protein